MSAAIGIHDFQCTDISFVVIFCNKFANFALYSKNDNLALCWWQNYIDALKQFI